MPAKIVAFLNLIVDNCLVVGISLLIGMAFGAVLYHDIWRRNMEQVHELRISTLYYWRLYRAFRDFLERQLEAEYGTEVANSTSLQIGEGVSYNQAAFDLYDNRDYIEIDGSESITLKGKGSKWKKQKNE